MIVLAALLLFKFEKKKHLNLDTTFFFYLCTPIEAEIVRWCNGSTADFGSACPGSNPSRTTV